MKYFVMLFLFVASAHSAPLQMAVFDNFVNSITNVSSWMTSSLLGSIILLVVVSVSLRILKYIEKQVKFSNKVEKQTIYIENNRDFFKWKNKNMTKFY